MLVAIHDAEGTKFPNLALMKLSAWHKAKGDTVELFQPLMSTTYDRIYSSKVFTFTAHDPYLPNDNRVQLGGTGYGISKDLPHEIEHTTPDYGLYSSEFAQGFATRGCPNKCPWCIVPKKEGGIRGHAEIDEFWNGQKELVLMDNNILAHPHGLIQLEKISNLPIRLDCNQGLDARLVDHQVAKLLGSIKWKCIRFACDKKSQMKYVEKAVKLIRDETGKKGNFFVYVLVNDTEDAFERVEFLRKINVDPFAQPYRDFSNNVEPSIEQKRFARWVNHKAIFKSVSWDEYNPNK